MVIVLGAQTDVALGASPTTVVIELAPEARELAEAVACAPEPDAPSIYLSVEDIEMERHPGVIYAIYLNLPGAGPDTPQDSAHMAGFLSFFGVSHSRLEPRGGHASPRREFDVTGVVKRLQAGGRWDPQTVTVTFVPVGLEPPEGYTGEPQPVTGAAEGAHVRLGRVALTAERGESR
jgi:hypothetical protein